MLVSLYNCGVTSETEGLSFWNKLLISSKDYFRFGDRHERTIEKIEGRTLLCHSSHEVQPSMLSTALKVVS